jgi:hypothetical protein
MAISSREDEHRRQPAQIIAAPMMGNTAPEPKREAPERASHQVFHGADDEIRTRDPHLGKVMLYQLSHVRV